MTMDFVKIAGRVAADPPSVPGGMKQWAWISQEGVRLVNAEDENDAYEKVIAVRMREGGQTREEAEGWFEKDDRIEPVLGTVEEEPEEDPGPPSDPGPPWDTLEEKRGEK